MAHLKYRRLCLMVLCNVKSCDKSKTMVIRKKNPSYSVLSDFLFGCCLGWFLLQYTCGWQVKNLQTIDRKLANTYISFLGYLSILFHYIFSHGKSRQFCYEDIQCANLDRPNSLPFIMLIKIVLPVVSATESWCFSVQSSSLVQAWERNATDKHLQFVYAGDILAKWKYFQ